MVMPAKGKQTYQNDNQKYVHGHVYTQDFSCNRKLLLSTRTAISNRSLEQSWNGASICQNANKVFETKSPH